MEIFRSWILHSLVSAVSLYIFLSFLACNNCLNAHMTIHSGARMAIKQILNFLNRIVHSPSSGSGILGWTAVHVQARMIVKQLQTRLRIVLELGWGESSVRDGSGPVFDEELCWEWPWGIAILLVDQKRQSRIIFLENWEYCESLEVATLTGYGGVLRYHQQQQQEVRI
jgi:hypothetical protein